MNALKRIFRRFEMILIVVPLVLLCLLIVLQIIMRTFFQSGIPWLEEFGRYVLVFTTFLGTSIAIQSDEHPRMTALLVALPPVPRQIVQITGDLICVCILLVLEYYACIQIAKMIHIGASASTLPIPMWLVYLIFPIAIFLMVIRYLISITEKIKLLLLPTTEWKEA